MNNFEQRLGRSAGSITTERAARWAKNAKKASQNIIDGLDAKIDSLTEKLENHDDVSTLVDAVTVNHNFEFNGQNHLDKAFELIVKIDEQKYLMKLAKESHERYFGEVVDEKGTDSKD